MTFDASIPNTFSISILNKNYIRILRYLILHYALNQRIVKDLFIFWSFKWGRQRENDRNKATKMSSHRLITKWKSAVTRIRCKLRSSNEVANNRSGVIRLGNRHGHRIALVRVFRLLDSHLRSDVSVLCWLVTNFREKRSSQAKAHCAGGRYDGEESKYLLFLARTKRNANEFKRNLLTAKERIYWNQNDKRVPCTFLFSALGT